MNGLKLSSVLALLLLILLQGSPANAQATRTWVSGVGDDVNPCSRTAPCKTFAGAISKTAAGGEISVLDPGGFGAVTITKSISIINDDSGEAGILAGGTNGVIVNAAATDVVILRGLVIDGGVAAVPGLNGVRFLAGAALFIEKSIIKNFSGAAPNGHGILFAPSSGTSELIVANTTFINNGNAAGGTGAGIAVQATGTAVVRATVSHAQIVNNNRGILVDSTTSTGVGTKLSLVNSVVTANTGFGIGATTAAAGGVPINLMISNSALVNNAAGIVSNGTAATVRLGGSTITGSTDTGAKIVNGGIILSYKNNQINDNVADGTPLTQVNLN